MKREDLLLALARADGQSWGSIAEASPHTAEMMYGRQADAVLDLVKEELLSDKTIDMAHRAVVMSISGPVGGHYATPAHAVLSVVAGRLGAIR